MDEQVDFEELIDLTLSVSQKNSQEPIEDILDKMCEAMGESNITMTNIFKSNENDNDEIFTDDDIINLDAFENLLATESLCNDESYSVTDDMLKIIEEKNDEAVPIDDIVNLDEFDNLLATEGLSNDEINSITADMSINEDMDKMPYDAIDLDEFASISTNACLFIDNEDRTGNSDNKVSNVRRVPSYEVSVEFENACAHTNECDIVKEEVTNTNKCSVRTISVETAAASNLREKCIDLETLEFSTVNPIVNKRKTVKEYDNELETISGDCKMETNITEDIVTLTINDNEVKYENAVVPSEIDCKNTSAEECDNKNTDSDDGYDSSDFEFISEQEASKAGIFTKMSKMTVNKSNKRDNTTESASNNATSTHYMQNTSGQTNNIDNRPRKNEASLSDYVKYSKYRYQRCYSRPASEFHEIPQGERYLDMFRGQYAPEVVNNLYSMRNKRVLSAVAMAASFEELAYRDPGQEDENSEKYKDEAEDCLQKIVSTYRYENRPKRRRH